MSGMSVFLEDPVFGDIVLFKDHYYGFIHDHDSGNLLIATRLRNAADIFYIHIPMEITHQMRNAACFYNVHSLLLYGSEIFFASICLRADDAWLRAHLEIPKQDQLPMCWRYKVLLSSVHGAGELMVFVDENACKTFKMNGYDTVKHMREYLNMHRNPKLHSKCDILVIMETTTREI
eukprot:667239_1